MTAAATLAANTLDNIVARTGLTEKHAEDLVSTMSPEPVGRLRVFTGTTVSRLVAIGMTVEPIGLDSHMIFAFTPPSSAVPHFTLDSVKAGPHFAFHIDLIPRVDLGANLDYIDTVFAPLTDTFNAVAAWDGLEPAHLSPRQLALMSPWMLAYRATEGSFAMIDTPLGTYLNQWFSLVESGLPSPVDADTLAARDVANRAALFNPDVDPVWAQVDKLLGEQTSARLRDELKEQA